MAFAKPRAFGTISLLLLLASSGSALARSDHDGEWSHFTAQAPAIDQPGRREWAWQGGDSLSVGGPGKVRYVPTGTPRIIITGDPEMVAAMEVDGGDIRQRNDFNERNRDDGNRALNIVVQGVRLNHFTISGSSAMDLGRVQGDALTFQISGSGSINAQGQARTLELTVSGSGKADLANLNADAAKIQISGSGSVTAGAVAQSAEIHLTGSGAVNLGSVKSLDADVTGSGRVVTGPAEAADINIMGSGEAQLGSRPASFHYNIMGGGRVLVAEQGGQITELARERNSDIRVNVHPHIHVDVHPDVDVKIKNKHKRSDDDDDDQ